MAGAESVEAPADEGPEPPSGDFAPVPLDDARDRATDPQPSGSRPLNAPDAMDRPMQPQTGAPETTISTSPVGAVGQAATDAVSGATETIGDVGRGVGNAYDDLAGAADRTAGGTDEAVGGLVAGAREFQRSNERAKQDVLSGIRDTLGIETERGLTGRRVDFGAYDVTAGAPAEVQEGITSIVPSDARRARAARSAAAVGAVSTAPVTGPAAVGTAIGAGFVGGGQAILSEETDVVGTGDSKPGRAGPELPVSEGGQDAELPVSEGRSDSELPVSEGRPAVELPVSERGGRPDTEVPLPDEQPTPVGVLETQKLVDRTAGRQRGRQRAREQRSTPGVIDEDVDAPDVDRAGDRELLEGGARDQLSDDLQRDLLRDRRNLSPGEPTVESDFGRREQPAGEQAMFVPDEIARAEERAEAFLAEDQAAETMDQAEVTEPDVVDDPSLDIDDSAAFERSLPDVSEGDVGSDLEAAQRPDIGMQDLDTVTLGQGDSGSPAGLLGQDGRGEQSVDVGVERVSGGVRLGDSTATGQQSGTTTLPDVRMGETIDTDVAGDVGSDFAASTVRPTLDFSPTTDIGQRTRQRQRATPRQQVRPDVPDTATGTMSGLYSAEEPTTVTMPSVGTGPGFGTPTGFGDTSRRRKPFRFDLEFGDVVDGPEYAEDVSTSSFDVEFRFPTSGELVGSVTGDR